MRVKSKTHFIRITINGKTIRKRFPIDIEEKVIQSWIDDYMLVTGTYPDTIKYNSKSGIMTVSMKNLLKVNPVKVTL